MLHAFPHLSEHRTSFQAFSRYINLGNFCVSVSQQEWGKLSSQFLRHQWAVIHLALSQGSLPCPSPQELLALARDTLAVSVEETAVTVMKCVTLIIPQVRLADCWLYERSYISDIKTDY